MAKKVRLRHRRSRGPAAAEKTLAEHQASHSVGLLTPSGTRAKLSWVLSVLGGLFALAAAVAGYSIWMILGRH